MARTINPIRKRKLKQALRKGMDAKNAQIKAGYKKSYARHSTSNKCVEVCQFEIAKEFDKSKITVDWVLNEMLSALNDYKTGRDNTNRSKMLEMFGKYKRMLKDGITLNNSLVLEQKNISIESEVKTALSRIHPETQQSLPDNPQDIVATPVKIMSKQAVLQHSGVQEVAKDKVNIIKNTGSTETGGNESAEGGAQG